MYFNSDWENSYKEIQSWYPVYYLDVREMVAILRAHGSFSDGVQAAIEKVVNDFFIDTADEETISRMEKFLGIVPEYGSSLEDRRAYVKSFFIGFGKISETIIKQVVKTISDLDVSCLFEPFDEDQNNCLYVIFEENADYKPYIKKIEEFLSRRVPAHIIICFHFSFRTEASLYTGSFLSIKQKIIVSEVETDLQAVYYNDIAGKPSSFPPQFHHNMHPEATLIAAGYVSPDVIKKIRDIRALNDEEFEQLKNMIWKEE